ncbi:restriction endonuclease subunit S [Roseovarius sp. MBR-6]|uniref:restriction endonuclease subunit S n=1 Tax=Roseovarius sp. MBR-6 TaxID=3156459 RepID=UPI00339855BE
MNKLSDLVEFNPSIRLQKGVLAPFIEMAALPTNARDIPEVRVREFSGSGSKFENGDTLFARITPCLENGKGGYVSTLGAGMSGHGSTEFIVMRARSQADSLFVYYVTRDPEFRRFAEKQMSGTSGRQRVAWQSIAEYELPTIEPSQRAAIAATLGALDDKIELNRKMNATLEAMARALFRDWFVDFGPTRAKAEGRAPYLSPDLWSLFPDRLDAEGKPEGWEVSTIGEVIELLDHKRVPLSSRERAKRQGRYPYHGATSVMDHIDDFLFDEKLLLLGEDGSVAQADGRPFTQYVWGKIWVNNHAHVIKGRELSVEQLKLFFDQVDIRPFVTGAVQPKLNQANLRRVPFLRASARIHSAFDAAIAPLFDLIRQNHEESRTLAQTRDLLLPRLMSGELRVAEAESLASEVA